ncbi:inner membrane protein [Xanthomonas oryzae pv. oryzicola BLS256]|uniref:Inner membrane protein n=1 Tax=Xanthomonas oryzae pv. oryzicola (strain BLS256) TaxID=383407 RepID=G7TE71_XANOB|nr:inner membrane protein [Xanthomonas oryzae pv. oryzicola BLS256]QEO97626.1 membrane protein [Xanthomonas oryzae pv. oryzicola]
MQVRPWPAGNFDGWEHGITWNHSWYLAYLLPYTVALMVLVSLSKLLRLPALPRLPSSVVVPALLVVPILWEAFCVMWVMPRHPPTHALVGDWFVHAESFPLLFGLTGPSPATTPAPAAPPDIRPMKASTCRYLCC